MNARHARPRILLSRCIENCPCRYDGSRISDPFVRALSDHAEMVTVCPEVEIGLGVPRPPIRLAASGGGVRLVQPATGLDLTSRMESFARERLEGIGRLDGAILKSRSPSCGIGDVKVHGPSGAPDGKASGVFGAAVTGLPGVQVITEGRLGNLILRERFLTAVFTLARLGEALAGGFPGIVEFHASAKLLLSAWAREEGRRLGRLVARGDSPELRGEYAAGIARAFATPPRRGPMTDTLLHAAGHFKRDLGRAEKAFFLDALEDYRAGRTDHGPCTAVIRSWIARFGSPWLEEQILFDPFPGALRSTLDTGGGKGIREGVR